MLRSAWLTFNGLAMLLGLHGLIIQSLLNGRWRLENTILFVLIAGLPAAVFVLLRLGDRRTAVFVGAFFGMGTLFFGIDTPSLFLRVLFLGHAVSSFAMLAVALGWIPDPDETPAVAHANQPPPPAPVDGQPMPQMLAPVVDTQAAIRSTRSFQAWRVLTVIPFVLGLIMAVLSVSVFAYIYFTEPSSFEGWGGLGALLLIAACVVGAIAAAICWSLLALAKRKAKAGVLLSMFASFFLLASVVVVQYGELAIAVSAWSLAHLISGVGVLPTDSVKALAPREPASLPTS